MTFCLSLRSLRRLEDVHPDLVRVVALGIQYTPHDFAVSEGVRSLSRQKELVRKGYSKTLNSMHLLQPDGLGHAVDLVAVGDLDRDGDIDAQDKSLTWTPEIYGEIAEALKRAASELRIDIRWGGDFKGFFDGPHFQLA